MTQILLIEPDTSLRTILKFNLMKNIGCDIIEKSSAEEAMELFRDHFNVDLIIAREIVGEEKTGLELCQYFEKRKFDVPVIIIGKKVSEYKNLKVVDPKLSWKETISMTGKILGIDIQFDENRLVDAYVPIGINYFFNITSISSGCDIFLRVKKGEGEYQYIKRLHSGDKFTRDDIQKYQEVGLKEFYISKSQFSKFVDFVTEELVFKMSNPHIKGTERIQLNDEAYEVTLDRIHSLGIDNHTIAVVDESIRSMHDSLQDGDALSDFLAQLEANKLSYAYAHSYLTALILHKIVDQFDWESLAVKEKLTYIAYFHDISLRDSRLMRINHFSEIETFELTKDEKKLILSHAQDSANIIERFPKIPNGIGTILREHHGSKSGVGFPDTLSIAIAPISMMFMVVEHFVDEFLKMKEGDTKKVDQIFRELHKRYNKVTYQQTVVALENMIQKKHKQAS